MGSNPTATANYQQKRPSLCFQVTGVSAAGCICGGICLYVTGASPLWEGRSRCAAPIRSVKSSREALPVTDTARGRDREHRAITVSAQGAAASSRGRGDPAARRGGTGKPIRPLAAARAGRRPQGRASAAGGSGRVPLATSTRQGKRARPGSLARTPARTLVLP